MIIQNFTELVNNQIRAIQSLTNSVLDFSIGSILRAISESNSAIVIWLQSLLLQILAITRASTSTGVDLDSWMLDYGLTRLSETASSGNVKFSRFTAGAIAYIPVGSIVETFDGAQQFAVVADSTNVNYNITLDKYVVASDSLFITIPVINITQGSGTLGNVLENTIIRLTQSIVGIDTVTNVDAFINGKDGETDSEFRTRFIEYIASLAKATKDAVAYAIISTQAGLSYSLTENYTYSGAIEKGYFYVVLDDGSGIPQTSLLETITSKIDRIRPVCSIFEVFSPEVVTANVSMTVTISVGNSVAIRESIRLAIIEYINGLGLNVPCSYTKLSQIAYNTSTFVTNVSYVLLNDGAVDIIPTNHQTIKAGTVAING